MCFSSAAFYFSFNFLSLSRLILDADFILFLPFPFSFFFLGCERGLACVGEERRVLLQHFIPLLSVILFCFFLISWCKLDADYAHRTLMDAFPATGLGVSVATDGTLYRRKSNYITTARGSLA